MRFGWTFSWICFFAIATPVAAQSKGKDGKATPTWNSRAVLSLLQTEVKTTGFAQPMPFSEFLEAMRGEAQNYAPSSVPFVVDEEAFRDEALDAPKIHEAPIQLNALPPKATLQLLFRQALKQLPVKSAFIVRAGRIDIVPASKTTKEYMLNQTFHVDFSDRRLDAALEELSELTGVSIVMDARAKQKSQTTVTACFRDDVALQDAVRMLADMAELKIVYLVTGLYVTTPEHAKEMQKELKDLYEPKAPPPFRGRFGPGGGGVAPDPLMDDPQNSPLAPPLPPALKRRQEAAA